MEQIEEVEKKKEKRLKNIVAEMSGESKESKKQVCTMNVLGGGGAEYVAIMIEATYCNYNAIIEGKQKKRGTSSSTCNC